MKIAINNRQKLLKINKGPALALITFFMKKANGLIPDRTWDEVSIVITDDRLMSSVNTEFMNDSTCTDVLSFCFPPVIGTEESFTGEIFVNADAAMRFSKKDPAESVRELALYIAHGCDHLMDQDDIKPADRARMRNRELRWLREADKLHLINDFATITRKAARK